MKTNNPYRVFGMGLIIAGAIFAPVAYFLINSIPLTSIALSSIMVGFTGIVLAASRPPISQEAARLLLETGIENIAALLEELGLTNKAVYLPSAMRIGNAQALIPLGGDIEISRLKDKIPRRLIVRWGDNPGDMAIAVTAPGGIGINKLEIKSGPTSSEIEQASSYVLTGILDMADSIEVHINNAELNVEVRGPELHYENIWYYRCLGSTIASVIASVASDGLGKPVRIIEESYRKGKSIIRLEVLS
jgi:hypothetical protein